MFGCAAWDSGHLLLQNDRKVGTRSKPAGGLRSDDISQRQRIVLSCVECEALQLGEGEAAVCHSLAAIDTRQQRLVVDARQRRTSTALRLRIELERMRLAVAALLHPDGDVVSSAKAGTVAFISADCELLLACLELQAAGTTVRVH